MSGIDSNVQNAWLRTPAILVWALAFYMFWNWGSFAPVWYQGDLAGPDSFLRLVQIKAWLAGQGWFDLTAYRMAPPDGADIHWSRLVDVPVGLLVLLFATFLDFEPALRLAAIVWPAMLYLATLWVVLHITRILVRGAGPLLVLFFFVFNMAIIAETQPGRLDHHNVQILLFALSLLGLVMKPGWVADGLVALAIPVSLAIGMDSAALFLPLLALIGLQWAFGMPALDGRLLRTGAMLLLSGVAVYLLSLPPGQWGDSRCDAFSLFYLVALVNLSAGFLVLGMFGKVNAITQQIPARLVAGLLVAVLAVSSLLWAFPHCASGPYGNLDPELVARWLSRVEEARGIFGATETAPQRWLGDFAYVWLVTVLAAWITIRNFGSRPEYAVLLCVLLFCAIGMFFQIRILRTGIIAAIPVCAAVASILWDQLSRRHFELPAARFAALGLACFLMTSFFWYSAGNILLGNEPESRMDGAAGAGTAANTGNRSSCSRADTLAVLRELEDAIIMSDLNTATPIMLHTPNTVISGPYHRNGEAILAVMDFFETDPETARDVAGRYAITHVAYCDRSGARADPPDGSQLQHHLLRNDLPDWLSWISDSNDKLLVLKVDR